MKRSSKNALELVSDIGSKGFELQHYSDREIAAAVTFLRTVNGPMFDWLVRVLTASAEVVSPQLAIACKMDGCRQLGEIICGGGNAGVGCGQQMTDLREVYRCADCSTPFHRHCIKEHFQSAEVVSQPPQEAAKTASTLTTLRVEEAFIRDVRENATRLQRLYRLTRTAAIHEAFETLAGKPASAEGSIPSPTDSAK